MSSPRSESRSPRSGSRSPINKELGLATNVSEDENGLEQLGRHIVDFINEGKKTVKDIASFVTNKIGDYNQSHSIDEITSVETKTLVEGMTPVEAEFYRLIQARPREKKKFELNKLGRDTYYKVLEYEMKKGRNKATLVKSAVEYHYDIIDERLTQLDRFKVIENAMDLAIEYINKNETDFLNPHNITSEYKNKLKELVHDAIILAQTNITGGRKNQTKGRPKRPRSSRKPRSTRKK
jgi:hypothetical protein